MTVRMNRVAAWLIVAFTAWAVCGSALAESKPADRMDDATSVLQQFVNIPENRIPPALLNQAYGIAVIPSVLKVSFIGGVRHGKGVLAVRTRNGQWSNPTFISLTGGSFGFQAGISSTDIVLVFKTRRSVQQLFNGQINLGADVSVAAGPVGRSAEAATNLKFNAEVYSYSRSRGLFAGVAVNGAHIGIDKNANWLYYDQVGLNARTLLGRSSESSLPKSGQRFVYTLNQYMPPSSDPMHYPSNTSNGHAGQSNSAATGSGQQNQQLYGRSYNGSAANDSNNITVKQTGGSSGGAGSSNYQGTYQSPSDASSKSQGGSAGG